MPLTPCERCKVRLSKGRFCYRCNELKDPENTPLRPRGERGECSRCGQGRWLIRDLCASCRREERRGGSIKGSPEYAARMRQMGERQRGAANPSWKGGRHVDRLGYVWLRVAADDEIGQAMLTSRSKQYVQEHRLVIAHRLGRPLDSKETVHHINGDKQDNRPENLKLFASQSEHHRHIHLETCPNCGYALRS